MDHSDFATALLDAGQNRPAGISDGHGGPANRRFDVYRNNVAVSLADALEASFPVIKSLVGDEFFRAMAGVALRRHPPQSPLMAEFGAEFPEFLSSFPPAASLPYLADVARLENALRKSYHASDAAAFRPANMQSLDPEAFGATCFALTPATQLIRSAHPVGSIWHANQPSAAALQQSGAQDVLIARIEYDPEILVLPQGAFEFLTALDGVTPLTAALAAAGDGFDFPATLTLCLSHSLLGRPAGPD